jgi:hypothetical protein
LVKNAHEIIQASGEETDALQDRLFFASRLRYKFFIFEFMRCQAVFVIHINKNHSMLREE